ncbi:hypothetical protein GPECTOR_87g405 [Gonium pectorale]|uniref:Uncharacterized protein n=1 Tax=Gonium pectorale TaxID=33097 RepID=A0A150G0Y4_GONPE|nr:hypothetical protein GPECTOR_87g405 [Gonium pectorale]|eukprot:KXZ43543.1 hypothetical protein GPECTOR_87g405 [Gonium pectorale]
MVSMDSGAAGPSGGVLPGADTSPGAFTAAAASVAVAAAEAMPPPSIQPQLRPEGGMPARVHIVGRRTSTLSLQTLESGELPCMDTPFGGTPSSVLQPLGSQQLGPRAVSGLLRGRLASLAQEGRASEAAGLDVLPAESGELRLGLADVATQLAEAGASKGEADEQQAAERASADGTGSEDGEAGVGPGPDGCEQVAGQSEPCSAERRRRNRWGAPPPVVVPSGSAAAAAAAAGAGSPGSLDLSYAKGLAAHLSSHGSLQEVVPDVAVMGAAGAKAAAAQMNAQGAAGQQQQRGPGRRSRSPGTEGRGRERGSGEGLSGASPNGAAAARRDKAERALAKLQQDRSRAQQSQQQAAPRAGAVAGADGRKPPHGPARPGRSEGRDAREASAPPGGGSASGQVGGGATGAGSGGGVLYDAEAVHDPPGYVRSGDDAPLSAGMEPDLLGFMALSMIQFSSAYMVESPRSLFNKAHIKALADEGRTMRRKADSAREANGNRWTPVYLTLYLQSALKSMESAYGHEQVGAEREAGIRSSSELLVSAAQVLSMVSHEANRLASAQHKSQVAAGAGAGGGGGTAPDGTPGAAGRSAAQRAAGAGGQTPPAKSGGGGSATPPPMWLHGTPTAGGRTPPPGAAGGGATPLGPLAAAVAAASLGGPAPASELLVLEAIRLLALKLTAICRTRWLLLNQEALSAAIKHHEPSPPAAGAAGPAQGGGAGAAGCAGGDDGGAGGRRTSPAAAADSASSTLEAAALSASTYTASIQQMAESVQAFTVAAETWRRAASEARTFNLAVSASGVEPAAVVAAARIGALGYEGGVWDLMGSVNLARKALDSITGML